MNRQWHDVAERLRREISEYGQLLHLFEEQHKLIFRRAPQDVLDTGRGIEAQVRVVDRERREREAAVASLAAGCGRPADASLRSLLPLVDPEARPLLQALVTQINLLIHRIRRDSRRNHRTLQCMVECHQELLRRLRPDAFTKTYARNGRVSVAAIRPAAAVQAGG